MRVVSVIYDELLKASNALLEMTIREYLDIGLQIMNNNPYQRKRVSQSSSIYSLLNQDLKKGCSVPTIVLAFTESSDDIVFKEGMNDNEIHRLFNKRDLIILDGLQRTYTMKDVDSDLFFPDEEKKRFNNHKLRIEVYCGLSKTGILYRMLTLNTGQTPMSKRHEIEILYSSYLDGHIAGITFNRQVDMAKQGGLDVYNFDDAIEGFNSFIDSDEAPIDRLYLLNVVQRLEKIANDNYNKDLFVQFIKLYNGFVHIIDEKTGHWTISMEQKDTLSSLYGKDIPSIFNKSQTISAFGAALSSILWERTERGFGNIETILKVVELGAEPNQVMIKLLYVLQEIREGAKKIGIAQRLFLKFFFLCLLNSKSESYLNFHQSIDKAKILYDGKTIQP